MRVSHGCVRLYPENIEFLYELVAIGEAVTIINEPYQMGQRDGVIYFEAHEPLEDDLVPAGDRLEALLDGYTDRYGQPLNQHLQAHVRTLAQLPQGVPLSIAMYDADEVLSRIRIVHNTVEVDPNAPTLSEVREMMDSLDEEAAGE